MGRAEGSEIPKESEMMNDFWKFRKDYYWPEDTEEYWDRIMDAADRLSKKHKSEYMDELLLICVYETEQRFMKTVPDGITLKPGRQLDNLYSRLKKKYTKGEGGM